MSKQKPDTLIPITCPVCTECYFHPLRGRCIAGGPYEGYLDANGNLVDREGIILQSNYEKKA